VAAAGAASAPEKTGWFSLDPITRRRLQRFRRIKRGWWSFIILLVAMALSVIAPLLAESRALAVWHQGTLYLPTFQYLEMKTFGQQAPAGWDGNEIETVIDLNDPTADQTLVDLIHLMTDNCPPCDGCDASFQSPDRTER